MLFSDTPFSFSGYARHTKWLAKLLQQHGHTVIYYGHNYDGPVMETEWGTLVGNSTYKQGEALFSYYSIRFQCDLILCIKDPLAIEIALLKSMRTPIVLFCPIDTEPMSPGLRSRLQHALGVFAPTRIGKEEIENVLHFPTWYTPHYAEVLPLKDNLRKRYQIPEHYMVATMIGDNNEYPSRKNLDKQLLAWYTFIKENPNAQAILFMHTNLSYKVNLAEIINVVEIPKWCIRYTPQDEYRTSMDYQYISDLYRMSDVLLQVSGGEGFSMTAVEAQAHGVPVLGNTFTALKETIRTGWLLDAHSPSHGDLRWHPWCAFRFDPNMSVLVEYYKQIYMQYLADGLQAIKSRCATGVADYTEERVAALWLQAIEEVGHQITSLHG